MHADPLSERLRLDTFDLVFMVVREPLARFRSEIVMRNPGLDAPWSDDARRFIERAFRRYPEDAYIADNHIRPQVEYYLPGAKVYRFEDGLDEAMADLRDTFDLELDLRQGVPHAVSRKGEMSGGSVEVPSRLQSDIAEFYREDYMRFGYNMPDPWQ